MEKYDVAALFIVVVIFPMGTEENDLEPSNIRSFQYSGVTNNPSVTTGVALGIPKQS